MLNRLVEKLIEDTKSNKIEWSKTKIKKEKYFIGIERYFTDIAEIGKIYISRDRNKGVYFRIMGIDNFQRTIYQDDQDDYINMRRLYNLVNDSYMSRISSGNLGNAITAYINRAD